MTEGNRIRELIAERGETFELVASRVGLTEKTVRNAANGRPTHRTTRRLIAESFGLTETEVFCPISTTTGMQVAS